MGLIEKIDRLKSYKLWVIFLGIAILSLLIVLLPFFMRSTYLVWTGQLKDGVVQHITFMEYLKNVGWLKAIGSYDYLIGLGADFLTSFSFYSLFDPFYIFVFLIPSENILLTYSIIISLKFIATAVTMFIYLRYKHVSPSKSIILSLMYMLTGYILFTFVRQINLTAGPIYLPLIIMGIEKVYNNESPILLMVSCFVCLISSFYLFYSVSVFSAAYAIIYYFIYCKKNTWVKLWKAGALYMVGALMAGFMLLPNFYGYINAARSYSKGMAPLDLNFLTGALLTFSLPFVSLHYSVMILNIFILILAFAALVDRKEETRVYKILTIALTIGFFMPLFGYFMNIFNYTNNRWSYLLSFSIFSMIGIESTVSSDNQYSPVRTHTIIKCLAVYLTLTALVLLLDLTKFKISDSIGNPAKMSLLILTGLLIWWMIATFIRERPGRIYDKFIFKPVNLFLLATVLVLVNGIGFYALYSKQHNGSKIYSSLFSTEERYVSQLNKTDFFRTDSSVTSSWRDLFTNRPLNNLYMGTRSYNTISNKYVYEFLTENGVSCPSQHLGIQGLDSRVALQSLLSVKYYYNTDRVSYGFKKLDQYDNLYLNNNFIPFGFVYTSTISHEKYDSLIPLDRQSALLEGMLVEGQGNSDEKIRNHATRLNYTVVCGKTHKQGISIDNGNTLSININGVANKEIYLAIRSTQEVNTPTTLIVSTASLSREYVKQPKGNLLYINEHDIYFNLGVTAEDTLQIQFKLAQGNNFTADYLEVYAYNIADFEKSVSHLKTAPHLVNVVQKSNSISGNIFLNKSGYLFLSLPYSSGFTALVDGKKTKIIRANTGFMAVEIAAGNHTVELQYKTPYLNIGILVSSLATLCAAAIIALYYFKKKKIVIVNK